MHNAVAVVVEAVEVAVVPVVVVVDSMVASVVPDPLAEVAMEVGECPDLQLPRDLPCHPRLP